MTETQHEREYGTAYASGFKQQKGRRRQKIGLSLKEKL
jgi:hypothetical protein